MSTGLLPLPQPWKEGFLIKKSANLGRLDRRYFKLRRFTHFTEKLPQLTLEYFLPPPRRSRNPAIKYGKRRGELTLTPPYITTTIDLRGANGLVIHTIAKGSINLLASSSYVAAQWSEMIMHAKDEHANAPLEQVKLDDDGMPPRISSSTPRTQEPADGGSARRSSESESPPRVSSPLEVSQLPPLVHSKAL